MSGSVELGAELGVAVQAGPLLCTFAPLHLPTCSRPPLPPGGFRGRVVVSDSQGRAAGSLHSLFRFRGGVHWCVDSCSGIVVG